MTAIYGGMLFENLVAQDKYFNLQMKLYDQKLVQGFQIRVAHPSFTQEITADDLPTVLSALPCCRTIVHLGAESVGVDLGENWDEEGIFAKMGNGRTWREWNLETLNWGIQVAQILACPAVLHPGYGTDSKDSASRARVISALRSIDNPVFLENVPPYANEVPEKWWGFGGTAGDMKKLLAELGDNWKCLIDFTHLWVTRNQFERRLDKPIHLEEFLLRYLCLPHARICHFSGTPGTLIDCHTDLLEQANSAIAFALRTMDAVCLEIAWKPDDPKSNIRSIENFREEYEIYEAILDI